MTDYRYEYEPEQERPVTIQEMVMEMTEYHINNLSWADIKGILEHVYAQQYAAMPPEALQDAYDGIFNR